MGELPKGWAVTPLGALLREPLRNGKSARASTTGEGTRTLTLTAVTKRAFTLENTKLTVATPKQVEGLWIEPGDIFVQRSNTPDLVGTAALYRGPRGFAAFPDLLIRVRLVEPLPPLYVEYCLRSPEVRAFFKNKARGIAGSMPKIGQETIEGVSVPLAPLPEQRRIVAAIEQHFSRLDAAVATLERVKAKLGQTRASVLKAAVEGRLVPTEAALAGAEGRDYEHASVLLERILAERRKKHDEAQAQAGRKTRYTEPVEPDVEGLPALPEGWEYCRIDTAGKVQLGRQRSPENHHGPHMRPYLRVANVFEDRIDLSDVMEMNFDPAEYERYLLLKGDVLLNEGQSPHLVGRPAMWNGQLDGMCFTNSLVRFQADPGVLPKYALIVFRAQLAMRRYMKIAKITTNIAHLGAQRFAAVEFPLPPLAEQHRIVAEVDRQLSVLDEVGRLVDADLARCARLRQAILKRAFEGRLVPQDPSDEPASVLLERIKAEIAKGATRSRQGRA